MGGVPRSWMMLRRCGGHVCGGRCPDGHFSRLVVGPCLPDRWGISSGRRFTRSSRTRALRRKVNILHLDHEGVTVENTGLADERSCANTSIFCLSSTIRVVDGQTLDPVEYSPDLRHVD